MPPAWKSLFAAASRDGSGNYIAGELSIRDVVADRVRDILLADAKVAAIFGTKVHVLEGPFHGLIGTAPAILIWTASTDEDQAPTNLGLNDVRLWVGILWRTEEIKVKAFGQPSVWTVVDHLKNVLRKEGNRVLKEQVGGAEKQLARKSNKGGEEFIDPIVDGREKGHVLLQFDWVYDIKTSLENNQIFNLT